MSERFDVAIVGGGIIGLSVANELIKAGAGRVVVLEAEPAVGQGSTSRANGGVRAQFGTAINITFSLYSIAEFERLESSTGLPGFHQTGYLMFTGTESGEERLKIAYELQRSLGVETQWLEAHDVAELTDIVRTDGIRAATFHARDGFLDPHGTLTAIKQEAQNGGAAIRANSGVAAVTARGGGFELATRSGAISAEWVVDSAGAHAREVATMVGLDVPVEPIRRNMAYMHEADPGPLIPMCVDLDSGVLVRREVGGGLLFAYSNPNDPPGWDTSLDPSFLDQLAERVGGRFPTLEGIPIDPHQCWAGLYPETPDHHAIIGAPPGMEHFVICAGFGGHGLMHSPAAGRAVAELISGGSCATFDLHPLRPSRFEEGDLVIEEAVF